MGITETLILFIVGFVSFFATGIDDTVTYAGSYLKNKKKGKNRLISLGIILGTIIALAIAIFAGSLLEALPARHLIGGGILILLGLFMFNKKRIGKHKKEVHIIKIKEHLRASPLANHKNIKFIGLGMVLFFATGIDDIITYANLILAKGSWLPISVGVMVATLVSLAIAHSLANKLAKFKNPERIGAVIIMLIGILLALKIL